MSLRDRMLKAMAHKNCSLPELADAAGVRTPSAHGWVNGDSQSLKAGPAIKAAAFLGVDALWLAEGDGTMISAAQYELPKQQLQHKVSEPVPNHHRKMVQAVCDISETIDDTGLRTLIDIAECLARNHPHQKAKPTLSA